MASVNINQTYGERKYSIEATSLNSELFNKIKAFHVLSNHFALENYLEKSSHS